MCKGTIFLYWNGNKNTIQIFHIAHAHVPCYVPPPTSFRTELSSAIAPILAASGYPPVRSAFLSRSVLSFVARFFCMFFR